MVCVRFLNWPVQRLQRQRLIEQPEQPALVAVAVHTVAPSAAETTSARSRPDVDQDLKYIRTIYPAARSGPCILAASEAAWQRGVRPGMPLAEARSMALPLQSRPSVKPAVESAVEFRVWDPADDRQGLCKAAELTRRFAPIVALDELPAPDSLLLDITGCAPLFGSETSLGEQLLAELRQAGYRCRAAIADTVAGAWAFAHTDTVAAWDLPLVIVPPGLQSEYFGNFPLQAGRLLTNDIEILHSLGIRTLRSLLSLPREDLPSRLSATAVTRALQLNGVIDELLTPLPEADPVQAAWSSEYPAENRNEVCQVLTHLLQELCEQLTRRRIGCIRLECELAGGFGSGAGCAETVQLNAEVVRATQEAGLLLDVLELRLEKTAIPETISRVRIHAITSPMPQSRQRDLFSPIEHLIPQDELGALVNRLSSRLGMGAVGTVEVTTDPRPEFSISIRPILTTEAARTSRTSTEDRLHGLVTPVEASPEQKPVDSVRAYRPLKLLAVPWLLPATDRKSLFQEGLHWQGRRERVAKLYGPERIQTSWWTDCSVHRDYYRAETISGSWYWLFRDHFTGQWFIHGLFE